MSGIDVDQLGADIVSGFKGAVGAKWPAVREYFEAESKVLAQRLATIAKLRIEGKISEQRAKELVQFQKNSFETVLLAVEGLTQLIIEDALNAGLKAVRTAINTAIGFALL
ncbi:MULTISPECIES: hypothetical protein [unclassified Variovorax]|uniref:hypothetical protein n=1 Tax=unclassified Variovorax TaxID=663243 RepID=UPI00076CE172|nr:MULTISPECIES: hypothetical protein [unclassified Variovorax]KWT95572.1 hypothetical protein APY03_2449 [Variovorax sp. WDL1]PNG50182.1 hypothetical protein CHC06_05805 [Variovorax sp. B2]PNG51055.1 hypothetical protein CHC07_05711 [Variovorax sp. B4]VTU42246.1 hypothetical protein SRS16P1_00222 [Variovorax sp. SRS16]VTU42271.1 hypothetical protein E5P1_00220 [Variovorax sp. PBL-E5]